MISGHPIVDYCRRLSQIMAVLTAQIGKLVGRLLRSRPLNGPDLLREGFEKAGGTFVKFGQILALQVDTLPRAYCAALMRLLDRVPAASREHVLRIFEEDLKARPEALFRTFDYNPIASASIGQVHRADLHDGTPVAVKVQRPDVHQDFHRDVLVMRGVIWVVFRLRIKSLYFMRDPVRELASWTHDELDYRREAAHCKLLADNAGGSATERIPRIYSSLTTARILTMEFLDGPNVSTYLKYVERGDAAALAKLTDAGFNPSVFSNNVITNFLRDAFRHGVFHADLHPANLLILPNNVVGYVDFGIVASLTPEARRKQIELTLAYASGNPEAIYQEFMNICKPGEDADFEGIRRRIAQMARSWYGEPTIGGNVRFRVTVTTAMMDLLTICRDYGVLVDQEMIKYIRSTILVDGLVSLIAPSLDIADSLRTVVEEYLIAEARRKILSRAGGLSILTDLAIWMKMGPAAMLRSLDMVERRQLRLRSRGSPEPGKAVTRDALRLKASAARAVWAILIAFLAVGGGLPSWKTAPLLAIFATVFVTSWTLWMLWLLRRLDTA
jgi:predicted unusual protein kinase regulating ubiquinone biosynthesis (AarF/ABC1/UbiB family)